jgi:hypothetical protein
MSKHRKTESHRVNPLVGGALLAGGMLMAAAPMASAETGVNGRPDTPFNQPGVNAIQTVGDSVFDNPNIKIPTLRLQGPVALSDTGLGQTYHGLFGNSTNTLQGDGNGGKHAPSQGLTVGVLNTVGTTYKVQCNIVIQRGCGGFG